MYKVKKKIQDNIPKNNESKQERLVLEIDEKYKLIFQNNIKYIKKMIQYLKEYNRSEEKFRNEETALRKELKIKEFISEIKSNPEET